MTTSNPHNGIIECWFNLRVLSTSYVARSAASAAVLLQKRAVTRPTAIRRQSPIRAPLPNTIIYFLM